MERYEFLKAVQELRFNRGLPVARIARAIGMTDRYLWYLINQQHFMSDKMLEKASKVLPGMLERFPVVYRKNRIDLGPGMSREQTKIEYEANEEKRKRRDELLKG